MEIQKITTPSFGIKIHTKTAIEAASGVFLEDAKISYPRQCKLFENLSGLQIKNLYAGEVATGMRNMSQILRQKHPELETATANIKRVCDEVNKDRTFLAKDEIIIKEKLKTALNKEADNIGESIDIEPISLTELKLKKYI